MIELQQNVKNSQNYQSQFAFKTKEACKKLNIRKSTNSKICFCGYKAFILDSGGHSFCLQGLMKNISRSVELTERSVKAHSEAAALKYVKDLKEELIAINNLPKSQQPLFLAIPALIEVPLNVLSDRVAGRRQHNKLTPFNIKDNKEGILDYLKYLSKEHDSWELSHIDRMNIGMGHTHEVIREINKAIENGMEVYIPAGHPEEHYIKGMCVNKGLKPELYHYIATGNDRGNSVQSVIDEVRKNNYYNFNLLALSNAKSVGINNAKGNRHIFSAYDDCVSLYTKGTFNLSPVRLKEKITGYSFVDEKVPIIAFDEFKEARSIEKFVGLKVEEVLASDSEHVRLKNINAKSSKTPEEKRFIESVSNKLFRVKDIYNGSIDPVKQKLKGEYVDYTSTYYFKRNFAGKIIFPQCNCDGTDRPSVHSMWGTCLGVMMLQMK